MATIHWASGASGDFSAASDWTGGEVPGTSDNAVIDSAGTYTVTLSSAEAVNSLTLDDGGATLAINTEGALTIGSTLSVTAGIVQLAGGEISGGVLSNPGGAFQWTGGTLDGVTYEGTLDLSGATGSSLYVGVDGLTVTGAGGTGSGTIDFTADDCLLNFDGTQTFDKATIDIGNSSGFYDALVLSDLTGKGAVLTLGSGLTIDHTGIYARITSSIDAGDTVLNKGVIDATLSGGQFLIDPLSFINDNTLTVSNGDAVIFGTSSTSFDNSAGVITVAVNSTVLLDCDLTTAELGVIKNAGSVVLQSTLTNAGAILAVGAGANLGAPYLAHGGLIRGGIIRDGGGGLRFTGGTLDGVTYEGTLDLSPSNSTLYVTSGGLTAAGAGGSGDGTIDLTGVASTLYLENTQTLDNATLDLGAAAASSLSEDDTTGGGAVLTLGAGLTIDHTGTYAEINGSSSAGDEVVNKGVINANFSKGQFTINPLAFVNDGTIAVSNGDTLTIDTQFNDTAGTLTVAKGSTVTLGNGFAFEAQGTLSDAGVIAIDSSGTATDLRVFSKGVTLSGGGTLSLGGSSSSIIGVSATATLTNVDDTIAGAGLLGLEKLTLINEAAGVIDASASGATLVVGTAPETVSNAGLMEGSGGGILVIASTTVNDAGGGTIATSGGRVELQDADILGGTLESHGGAIVVNLGSSTLDGSGGHAVTVAAGGITVEDKTSLTLLGSIVNKAALTVGGFTNATDLVIGAGGATLSGGGEVTLVAHSVNGVEAATAATLTNVDNRIVGSGTIGGSNGLLTLVNEASGFIGSSGVVAMTIDTGSHAVTNAGTIEGLDAGLTIDGAVVNTGKLVAYLGDLTIDGAVSGSGTASLGSGVLTFGSSFDENVTFGAGKSTLVLAKSQSYGGTITGFTKTGSTRLDLEDIGFVSASEATWSASTGILTVTDGTHTAKIHLAGTFTAGSFTASSDGHGGTLVVDPAPAKPASSVHPFIQATATFGGASAAIAYARVDTFPRHAQPVLIARTQ